MYNYNTCIYYALLRNLKLELDVNRETKKQNKQVKIISLRILNLILTELYSNL